MHSSCLRTRGFHAPLSWPVTTCRCLHTVSILLFCLSLVYQDGGGLYNAASGVVKFLKRAKVSFTESSAAGNGGHVYNMGSLILRNTGYFAEGYSDGSGGAIYSRGIRRMSPTPGTSELK